MAWENFTYSCGHEAREQFYGKMSERERKIEWLESVGLCPECYKKKMAEEKEKAGVIATLKLHTEGIVRFCSRKD